MTPKERTRIIAGALARARSIADNLEREVAIVRRRYGSEELANTAKGRATEAQLANLKATNQHILQISECVSNLARALDAARTIDLLRAVGVARDLHDLLALTTLSAVTEELVDVLGRAWSLGDTGVTTQGAPALLTAQAPTQTALRALRAAIRIVPSCYRSRFDEEFRSELFDLATAGATRIAQVRYALRQVNRAFELRAELRRPNRQGART
ncbi:hypothetical protein [Krasilnikovia sp. MM14-A1259]|uniref:hypothetical protein n=1 Tax=Krasilnikovia sp. MM14-A1259 TaxID=3373539 RepID=UPI003825A65C